MEPKKDNSTIKNKNKPIYKNKNINLIKYNYLIIIYTIML